jgi:protein tyrosine/serine phosphatase
MKVRFLFLVVVTLIVAMSGSAMAQNFASTSVNSVTIKNFGQMDDRFFRGAQPKEDQYKQLADLGIKTIIDLRNDPMDYEKPAAEALGMRYVNIPMSDKDYPESASIQQVMKLIADPSTGKFYVHCAGGRHRTGVIGAVYRFNNYNWSFEQVYKEMKDFDFYTRWGHGNMKKFVEDYSVSFQQNVNAAAATQSGNKQ